MKEINSSECFAVTVSLTFIPVRSFSHFLEMLSVWVAARARYTIKWQFHTSVPKIWHSSHIVYRKCVCVYISWWHKTLIGSHIKEAISFEVTYISSRGQGVKSVQLTFCARILLLLCPDWGVGRGWQMCWRSNHFEGWTLDSFRNKLQHCKYLIKCSYCNITTWWSSCQELSVHAWSPCNGWCPVGFYANFTRGGKLCV